ncbi:MAG: hypothetical protein JSU77_03695 [Fidelibacterota bacterium]|nr:MAG: hypothetical protein JSU77_03695 [Candidatus Neomarinimicrobiota bacterium]
MKKASVPFFLWVLIVFVLTFSFWLTPDWLKLGDFQLTKIAQLIASLLFISLILERALEVFMTAWRRPEAALKDLEIQRLQEKISKLEKHEGDSPPDKVEELKNTITRLESIKQERTRYRSDTQRLALWISVILGFLISAVGIQGLHQIIDPEALEKLPKTQAEVFQLVDVFLTGGIIAGGSEGIHKIAEVYNNFMESTANRARAGGS